MLFYRINRFYSKRAEARISKLLSSRKNIAQVSRPQSYPQRTDIFSLKLFVMTSDDDNRNHFILGKMVFTLGEPFEERMSTQFLLESSRWDPKITKKISAKF